MYTDLYNFLFIYLSLINVIILYLILQLNVKVFNVYLCILIIIQVLPEDNMLVVCKVSDQFPTMETHIYNQKEVLAILEKLYFYYKINFNFFCTLCINCKLIY